MGAGTGNKKNRRKKYPRFALAFSNEFEYNESEK